MKYYRDKNWPYSNRICDIGTHAEFIQMCNTKHIQLSEMRAVEDDSENVYVTNVEGNYYAIGNVCTRLGGPLAEGKLKGYEIQCPWRGSKFDVRTGK